VAFESDMAANKSRSVGRSALATAMWPEVSCVCSLRSYTVQGPHVIDGRITALPRCRLQKALFAAQGISGFRRSHHSNAIREFCASSSRRLSPTTGASRCGSPSNPFTRAVNSDFCVGLVGGSRCLSAMRCTGHVIAGGWRLSVISSSLSTGH